MTHRPPDHELSHEESESLLAPYALDAVDPGEAAAVERHLAGCPRCRSEFDAYRELAAGLGTAAVLAETGEPPPGLWDRIARELPDTRRAAAPPMPGLDRSADAAEPPPPGALPGPAPVVSIGAGHGPTGGRRGAARGLRWAGALAAAAAVVAIALLGVSLARTSGQLGQARDALGARGSAAAVQAALADPAHRLVRLDSPGGVQLAEFVVVPGGQGLMVSSALPAIPADETYQLWAMLDGQPISVGLLGSRPQHAAFTVVSSLAPSALAITVEPAGGVTTPDRAPVASGAVVAA